MELRRIETLMTRSQGQSNKHDGVLIPIKLFQLQKIKQQQKTSNEDYNINNELQVERYQFKFSNSLHAIVKLCNINSQYMFAIQQIIFIDRTGVRRLDGFLCLHLNADAQTFQGEICVLRQATTGKFEFIYHGFLREKEPYRSIGQLNYV